MEAEILQPKRHGVELQYEFRHALLQRMARDSMIEPERRAMHGKIVSLLRADNDAPMPAELMAYHLTELGAFADAIKGWFSAGLQSARQSAHLEAIDHLRKGLSLLDRIADPDQRRALEIDLQTALIGSITITQGPTSQELSACCERGLLLCGEGGRAKSAFPFIFGQFTFTNCRGQIRQAKELADLFLSHAEAEGYDAGRVVGHRLRGLWLLNQGDAPAARLELLASLDLYRPERDARNTDLFGQDTKVHSQSLLALTMFVLGEVEHALRLARDILVAADALRHPNTMALSLVYLTSIFGYCDSPGHLMHAAKRLFAIAEEHKLGGFRAHGAALMGWALAENGDPEQGVALLSQAIRVFDGLEYRLGVAGHLTNLAAAQRRAGRLEEAKTTSARVLEMTASQGPSWFTPETYRIAALIDYDLSPDNRPEVIERLQAGIRMARDMKSPVFESRCQSTLKQIECSIKNEPQASLDLSLGERLPPLKELVDRVMGRIDDAL